MIHSHSSLTQSQGWGALRTLMSNWRFRRFVGQGFGAAIKLLSRHLANVPAAMGAHNARNLLAHLSELFADFEHFRWR
jgi:hypothetical protein